MKMRFKSYCGRFLDMLSRIVKNGTYPHRVYVYREDSKVMYLSISKSACTSIKASMLSLGEKSSYMKVHREIKGATDSQLFNINTADYPDYFKFTFVRNPFDRLASLYKNKYHTDKKLLGTELKHLYFDYYLFGFLRKDRGFASFARRVCMIPDVMSDKHFVSQSFLTKKGNFDFTGRFENLVEEYEPIREKYGFGELSVYNSTHKGNWMDYYDVKTAKRVYKRYKKDIEQYGYEDEYRELLACLEAKK
ncbi:MAG: sulfotransferase family 2 domain-containing protein [Clostridia bacterium]|nr:sulfotransferase family 2 domain-containing protein [Clostridia bacterium]